MRKFRAKIDAKILRKNSKIQRKRCKIHQKILRNFRISRIFSLYLFSQNVSFAGNLTIRATVFVCFFTYFIQHTKQSYLKVFYWKCLSVSGSVSEIQQSHGHILIKEKSYIYRVELRWKCKTGTLWFFFLTADVLHKFVLQSVPYIDKDRLRIRRHFSSWKI